MKRVLTIAGSDPSGGAGVQADLKAITVLGGYGMSVLTALTAQNTLGVSGVHLVPPEFVAAQLDAVLGDVGADAAKCGMLATAEIVAAVAEKVRQYQVRPLVVDPVMIAKSGHALIDDAAKSALKEKLLPLASLATPNLPEAEELAGMKVGDEPAMVQAARRIGEYGCAAVLIKGGHLPTDPVDILYDGQTVHRFPGPRLTNRNTHGTGCTLSAALATLLAQGLALPEAVGQAKRFISRAIALGLSLGQGIGPTNPWATLVDRLARGEVLEALAAQAERLERVPAGPLIPEIGSQLAYALPLAETFQDVAAFPGRIVKFKGGVRAVGCPTFGASRHTAKVILAARRFEPSLRAAMPLAYSPRIVQACRELGLKVGSFSRDREPAEVRDREGSSLEWGTTQAFQEFGCCQAVYDLGGLGKEPVVRLLGKDPEEVVAWTLAILGRLA
jgi:hydroxymethylpyrimidine/phosphomethylpyrimidine kinase